MHESRSTHGHAQTPVPNVQVVFHIITEDEMTYLVPLHLRNCKLHDVGMDMIHVRGKILQDCDSRWQYKRYITLNI